MAYRRAPMMGGRGMGDATCPSLQQLQGITDVNDPCQGYQNLPVSNPGLCYGPSGSTVPCPAAGQVTNLLPSALGPYTAPAASSSLSSVLSQIQAFVVQNPLVVGGLAIGLVLVSMVGGRRR